MLKKVKRKILCSFIHFFDELKTYCVIRNYFTVKWFWWIVYDRVCLLWYISIEAVRYFEIHKLIQSIKKINGFWFLVGSAAQCSFSLSVLLECMLKYLRKGKQYHFYVQFWSYHGPKIMFMQWHVNFTRWWWTNFKTKHTSEFYSKFWANIQFCFKFN